MSPSPLNIPERLQQLLLSANYSEIIELCSRKSKSSDSYLLQYYYLALAYGKQGMYEKALAEYQRCIKLMESEREYESYLPSFVQLELANVYNNLEDYEAAIRSANAAHKRFKDINDTVGVSRALYNRGTAELCQHDFEKAILTFKSSLKLTDDSDLANKARVLLNQANAYQALGNSEEVLRIHLEVQEVLDVCDGISDDPMRIEREGLIMQTPLGYVRTRYQTLSYRSAGFLTVSTVLSTVGLYEKANEYLKRGVELARRSKNVLLQASYENNIAHNFLEIHQHEAALPHLRQARECLKIKADQYIEASLDFNTAKYFMLNGERGKALDNYKKAVKKYRTLSDVTSLSNVLLYQSRCLSSLRDYDAGSRCLQQSIECNSGSTPPFTIISQTIEKGAISYYRKSRRCLKELRSALALADQYEQPSAQLLASTLLAKACIQFKMPEDAAIYYQRSQELTESEYSTHTSRQLRFLSIVHTTEVFRMENESLSLRQQALVQEKENLVTKLSINNKSMLIQLEELTTFRNEIVEITKQLDKAENILKKVKTKLKEAPVMQSSWEHYLNTFRSVHPDFERALLEKYPSITKMELKICTLSRAGLDTPKIAQLLFLSERSIENHRLRIRKKLGLKRNESIPSALARL